MDVLKVCTVIYFVVISLEHKCLCQTHQQLQSLRETTLTNYTRWLIPVENQYETLDVALSFLIRTVNEFDDVRGKLSTVIIVDVRWNDAFIRWNPLLFGGAKYIHLPAKDVWIPNIILTNPFEQYNFLDMDIEGLTVLYSFDGNATLYHAGYLKTICTPFVKYFPYDNHTCEILFGIFGYHPHEVRIRPGQPAMDTRYLIENSQWEIEPEGVSVYRLFDIEYVKLGLILKRRAAFLLINLFIPICFLVFMNFFAFVLPVESGEKASYSITILLSLAIFITIVMNEIPPVSSDIPVVSYILLTQLFTNVFVCVSSITSIHYFYKDDRIPKKWYHRMLVTAMKCRFKRRRVKQSVKDANVETIAKEMVDDDSWITWKLVSDAVEQCHIYSIVVLTIIQAAILISFTM